MFYSETRKGMVNFVRRYRGSDLAIRVNHRIKAYDRLSPGWKWVKSHWIEVRRSDGSRGLDLVEELPGHVFIRGWDFTGVIDESWYARSRSA